MRKLAPRTNDATHYFDESRPSPGTLPEPRTSKKRKPVRPHIAMLGDGPLGTALEAAGLTVSELLVEQSVGSRTRPNQTQTNHIRAGAGPSPRKTVHQHSRVFILAENPPPGTTAAADGLAYIGHRFQEGDLLLIERHSKPGDTEGAHSQLTELRPDLVDGSSHDLLIDIAYVPVATHRSAQSHKYQDRFVGGITPKASKRARKILRHVHAGPILATDARTVEEILAERPQASSTDGPTLSIIMPAFNVSEYVNDSIDSILKQNLRDLELIVVDDGSTDATAAQVESLAERDHRITLIRTPNQGPGVARNRGISAAHGRYLTFADADDRVLPGAYSALVGSLEDTSSDLATGTYVRIGPTGVVRPQVSERVHSRIRTAITLADAPELLEEPVVWNKVFRRDLWDRAIYAFPDATNYEDQEPAYRALIGAKAIDVLTKDVYAWRLPDGRPTRSRGQNRRRNLRARLDVVSTLEPLLDNATPRIRERAYATWVGRDLMMHAEKVPEARKKFFRLLSRAARSLILRMPYASWDLIASQERYLAHAVASGSLADVEEILGTRAEETTAVPLKHDGLGWVCAPTYLQRLKTPVPDDLTRARNVDFTVRSGIRSFEWTTPSQAVVSGYAYIPGVDPTSTTVELVGYIGNREVLHCPTASIRDERAAQDSNDPWHDVAPSGFTSTVTLPNVRTDQRISLLARVSTHEITAKGRLKMPIRLAPAPLQTSDQKPNDQPPAYRWVARRNSRHYVQLDAVQCTHRLATIENATTLDNYLHVTLSERAPGTLVATTRDADLTLSYAYSDAQGAHYTIPTSRFPACADSAGERFFSIVSRAPGRDDSPIPASAQMCRRLSPDAIRISPDKHGYARIAQRTQRVTASHARVSADGRWLTITGRADPPAPSLRVILTKSQTTLNGTTHVSPTGSFVATIPLTRDGSEGATVSVPSGGYFVRYDVLGDSNRWIRTSDHLTDFSATRKSAWNTVRIEERQGNTLAISISAPLTTSERSKYQQFQLRGRTWGPLIDGVVFESFNGKGSSGNARALLDALKTADSNLQCWWSVRDRATEVPAGATPLVIGTETWHQVMATARVWVNDNNFPYYIRKRPGQFYVQTWHGTPIKRLLWDLPRRKAPLTYRRLMRSEVRQWDLLLAQTDTAAANLASGLGYRGQFLIGEYPRNARMVSTLTQQAQIRRRLNVPENSFVILYAPTWRNAHRAGASVQWTEMQAIDSLTTRHNTTVVARAHHITAVQHHTRPNLVDATSYPHVEHLLSIANALVTDFSSIKYDFEATGKPTIHLLEHADSYMKERGVYRKAELTRTVADSAELETQLHSLAQGMFENEAVARTRARALRTTRKAIDEILRHAKLSEQDNS